MNKDTTNKKIEQIQKLKKNQKKLQKLFSFDDGLHNRISSCSDFLFLKTFEHIKSKERKRQYSTSRSCHLRFCPLCNFYRVKRLSPQIVRTLRNLKEQGKELIFLTFTVPNCKLEDIKDTIQRMNKSFNRMTYNDAFKNNITHWIRTLEITFKHNEAHPHFHCIFAVDRSYFKHDNYLRTADWSKLWTRAYKSDRQLIVDARAIRPKKNSSKDAILSATAELSKYVIKSADLFKLNVKSFEEVYWQLKCLRFIVTSRNIKLDENKDEQLDEELWKLIEIICFRWQNDEKQYKTKIKYENVSMS